MISQTSPFLDFTPGYILKENEETMDYYRSSAEEPRPWSFGMYRSRPLSFTWLIIYPRKNYEIFNWDLLPRR